MKENRRGIAIYFCCALSALLIITCAQKSLFAQEIDSLATFDYTPTLPTTNSSKEQSPNMDATTEQDVDNESLVVEVENDSGQLIVDIVSSTLDIISEIENNKDGVKHFAIYGNGNNIVEYSPDSDTPLTEKFDVIKGKDNEEYDFTFIRQTIYNENKQAWDYIYEHIYNNNGKLIYFVRKFNTYDSGCAEVAFEESEYFYDEQGNLVKKTYDIFDSNNNALDASNCWMNREAYEKYMSISAFQSQYPFPETTNTEE